MSDYTVYKLDEKGQQVWQYPATLLSRDATSVRLEAFFNRDDTDLGFTVFSRGDRFVEYFYNDRWYNIFAVYEGEGERFKGWYCNICYPAEIGETAVYCRDLALDLWVSPAGETLVLDEDEFAALVLPEADRERCRKALAELCRLAAAGVLPE